MVAFFKNYMLKPPKEFNYVKMGSGVDTPQVINFGTNHLFINLAQQNQLPDPKADWEEMYASSGLI